MNRILADTMVVLNAIGALALFFVFVALGHAVTQVTGHPAIYGLVFGGIIGLAVAALFCGVIAMLALIESHLRRIAEKDVHGSHGPMRTGTRMDPRF